MMNRLTTKEDMKILSDVFLKKTPSELPISFGYGNKRINGIPDEFNPQISVLSVNDKVTKTLITGTDDKGLQIRVECTEYADFPVVEYVAFFTNTGNEKTDMISNIRIYDKKFCGTNPTFTYGNGDTKDGRGYEMKTEKLWLPFNISPIGGFPTKGASPFMRLMFSEYGLNIAVGWPGQWDFCVSPLENKPGEYLMWLGQSRCRMNILPGETIRTPSVTLLAFKGDEDKGRNLWRRFYFAHIIPKPNEKPLSSKLVGIKRDTRLPEFTSTTEKHLTDALDLMLENGYKPDLWWIDAGWYKCDNNWWNTGTWELNQENFPNGLGKFGKKLKDNDIDFLLWFEPERVEKNTEIWNEHPEWVMKVPTESSGVLKLHNKECLDWIIDRLDKIIKECHVTIYRVDFNLWEGPLVYWMNEEEEGRIGAVENGYVQGYLKIFDSLMERNPGLLIDNCAGGGRRNEMESLRRSVPFHYTDIAYGCHPIKQKQHRYMYEWIPYFRSNFADWRDDNGKYLFFPESTQPLSSFKLHNILSPVICMGLNFKNSKDEECVKNFLHIWRKSADIMLEGDYYPLTECRSNPADFYAVQFDTPEKKTGYIQIISNPENESESITLYPKLDENKKYIFSNPETGEEFILDNYDSKTGFIAKLKKADAQIWFYTY